jgi:hypothetical protein
MFPADGVIRQIVDAPGSDNDPMKPPSMLGAAVRRLRHAFETMLMSAGLGATGCLLTWLGFEVVSEALSYAGRLTGFFALAAALVTLVASVAVIDYYGKHRVGFSGTVVLVGALTVLVVNLMLLAVQVQGREYTIWLLAWITFVVWSIWALWELLHRRKVWEEIRAPRAFASGALAATLIGVSNFAYAQIYTPYSEPLLVSMSSQFEKPVGNRATGGMALPLRLTVQNTGKVGAYFIEGVYSVYGRRESTDQRQEGARDWLRDAEQGLPVRQNFEILGYTMIESGVFITPGGWIDPGASVMTEEVVQLPKQTPYQAVVAVAQVELIRKDRVSLDPAPATQVSWDRSLNHVRDAPSWVASPGTDFVQQTIRLHEGNSLIAVTRQPKRISVWWVLHRWTPEQPYGPYLQQTITSSQSGENVRPTATEVSSFITRYGWSDASSGMAEMPVGEMR